MAQTPFNYNSSFQDKKTIYELQKENARLKAELAIEKQNALTTKLSNYEAALLACEKLKLKDKIKLAAVLNQEIKQKQANPKSINKNSTNKTEYIAARIFKTRPAKKAALINSIKTMFQDEMPEAEIEKIIFDLQKRNFISVVENKIIYKA